MNFMSKIDHLYRTENKGDLQFEISTGDDTYCFSGEDIEFLSLIKILNFTETLVDMYVDLSPRERDEAATVALRRIHEEVTTKRNLVRRRYTWPMADESDSRRESHNAALRELSASINEALREYVREQFKKAAPLRNNVIATYRGSYIGDDALFQTEKQSLAGFDPVTRHTLAEALRKNAKRIVTHEFSGLEHHLFLKLTELHYRYGRPTEFQIERSQFLRELGITAKGGSRMLWISAIKEILLAWSTQTPYRVMAPETPDRKLDFTRECFLPRMREFSANTDGVAAVTVWVFSACDALLFDPPEHGYKRIPTRPFALITEALGNTQAADRAKHALGVIATELAYDRKHPFNVTLETLRITHQDFARHTERRRKALEELSKAVGQLGASIRIGDEEAKIEPK